MYKISFIVDHTPTFYYQAELLLFSLDHFAKHDKNDILVQCTKSVDEKFLSYLKKNNYSYKIIEPFLDGKYCNKVQQLEAFYSEKNCQGVFLLDTDVFVLEPLSVPDPNVFCAKIVDAPNPPIAILKNIFDAAGIKPPQIKETDWGTSNETTFSSNFNGGFYYVPTHSIKTISEAWKKWASWLYSKPGLFERIEQAIHTDQVSMAMALGDTQTEHRSVSSNFNCPIHSKNIQKYFEMNDPVRLLHYHREINNFGLLKKESASNDVILKAIEKANSAIAGKAKFIFYEGYRKSLVRPIDHTDKTKKLYDALSALQAKHQHTFNLILHAGTPKTGTTSMQFFLDQNQEALKKAGFIYPKIYSGTYEPKHQWLVHSLLNNDENILIENFTTIFSQLQDNAHSILLSAEGIYNHWFDYSQEAKSFLSVFANVFNLSLWVWFRKPLSFMNSLYCQNLKNPKTNTACFGQDISFSEMLEDDWFATHLDYLGFIYEMEIIVKKENIKLYKHTEDVIPLLCNILGLHAAITIEKENTGLSDFTIDLLRSINRLPLNNVEKGECVELLIKIDKIISVHPQQKTDNVDAVEIINTLSSIQLNVLKENYHLHF